MAKTFKKRLQPSYLLEYDGNEMAWIADGYHGYKVYLNGDPYLYHDASTDWQSITDIIRKDFNIPTDYPLLENIHNFWYYDNQGLNVPYVTINISKQFK